MQVGRERERETDRDRDKEAGRGAENRLEPNGSVCSTLG